MTMVGVDFEALNTGAGQIGQASDQFARSSGQVGATPGATAPDASTTALLDRLLDCLVGGLRKAARELDDLSSGLAGTASGYQQVEQVLANWNVPGETTL